MMKKLLAILLMLMLCAGMVMTANAAAITAVKPAAGDGSANNPYLISTAAELYWFANAVNQGDYDACARLTADITVNAQTHDAGGAVLDNLITWMPIGSGANPYTGTFDGGNHTVSGLYFERSVMYMGFFGSVDRGSVLNLTVADSVFLGRNSFVGMICGQNLEGTITNCHARNCILVGMNCTGGIAGSNEWGGTISRCSSDTVITCDGERAGGIAGYNDGAITNCYNTGSMAGDDVIGGIAGYMETTGSISCCYNTGSVIGINTSKNLGGIVGNAMNVTSCYYLNSIGNSLTNQKGKALTAAQMTDDNTWRTNHAGFSTSIWSKDANAGSKAYLPKLNSHSPYLPGFSVTVTTSGSGTASASPKAGATGTEVSLEVTPNEGYRFVQWQVVKGDVTIGTDHKFTIGSADVEIKAIFEEIPATVYTVTINTQGSGTVTADPASSTAHTDVTLTITPTAGWELTLLEVGGTDITEHVFNNQFQFTMPESNITVNAVFNEIPPVTYTVTVVNGTGSGEYEEGATVAITADAPAQGKQFSGWTSADVTFADATAATTTFVMPAKAVTVTANYEDIPPVTYTVTVVNGSGSGEYEEGATVAITADAPAQGKQFSGWTSADVTFADASSASTTFVMPAKAVTVTANYEDIPPVTYTVTVTTDGNGTASANPVSGVAGSEVTLTATANEGYIFKEWQVVKGGVNVTDNKFTMGSADVEIKAIFEAIPVQPDPETYTLTFDANGGAGSMEPQFFTEGEAQPLTANTFTREGYTFTGWNMAANGAGMGFADGASVMLTGDTTIYAQWKANEAPKPDPDPQPDPKPETNPLMIIRHPADQLVSPGETAEFSVLATGDGLTYQWYINRNDGRGWVKLQGAVNASHTTSPADTAFDGFQYACEVRDMHGSTARSQIAVLYIAAQPDVPATGDSTNISLLCAMLFISCVGYSLIAANRKRAVR